MIINEKGFDFLSHENTLWLRGVLAVLIFIAHVPSYLGLFSGNVVGSVLSSVAAPCVAIFFFLSGFGLTISYLSRGIQYVHLLPKKRVIPLYIKCIFLIIFYLGLHLVLGNPFEYITLIKSFLIGGTYVANGWYLQTLLLFYLLFFVVFTLHISNDHKIVAMFFLTSVYYSIFYLMGIESSQHFWFSSIFLFPIGILYAMKRNSFDIFLQKRKQ